MNQFQISNLKFHSEERGKERYRWAVLIIVIWACLVAIVIHPGKSRPAQPASPATGAEGRTQGSPLREADVVPTFSDSGVPQREVDELVKLYRAAQLRLREIVKNPPGGTQGGREFRQGRAAQLLAQVDSILGELGQRRGLWIGKNVPQAYRDGLVRADAQAVAAGVRPSDIPIQGSFSLIDRDAVIVVARDIAADLAKAEKSLGENTKSVLRQTSQLDLHERDIDRIIAGGIIEGTPVQTIKKLRDELTAVNGGTVTFNDKNGNPISFDAKYYASMVVRTKTREAMEGGRHARLERLGLDTVVIIGAVSKNFCTAYLGQAFSLSGKSSKYPPLSSTPGGKGPPFHLNCTKSTRPFVEDLATDQQIENADGLDDADKLLNVSATEAQRRYKDLQVLQQVQANYAKNTVL